MAIYIGIKKNTLDSSNIRPSDIKCVVDPGSKTSFTLNLTKSDPWTINGTFYIVYKVGTNSYDITSICFVHSHNNLNIKTIDALPLNSRVIYCSSLSNSFSGGSGYPSGIIYYFDTVLDVKKSNTWHEKTIPHELAGTSYDYIYHNKNQSTVSSGKCTDYGFCPTSSSDGVSIVELYHSTNGVANVDGFYTSIINRSASQSTWYAGIYKSWMYDYKRMSNTGVLYSARINGTGRKVFAIHNTTGGDCNLAIAYGGSTTTTLSDIIYTTGAFGYTKVAYNTWAHHETQDGKHYYSITVNGNNKFIETTVKLKVSKIYNIKMHTYSEANYDGIVISTKKLTSASLSSSSTDGITKCSGVDKTLTHRVSTTSSSETLYIYFKTNASTLKGPGDVDSTGASTSTTSNYSTGDIEIEEVCIIHFDANGGTGSPEDISVPAGESVDLSTIKKPTRNGWKFYKWFQERPNFHFVPDQFTPVGYTTVYAMWDNYPKFTELSDKSAYCTSSCEEASSTQGSKSIKLFGAPGMICSAGTVTYVANKSSVYPKGSPNSPISGATIQPTGGDNNVTVPEGTPAGDYIASIAVCTSRSIERPGSYYGPTSTEPVIYNIPFTIKATTLTYGPVEFIQHTPDDIIEGNITQQKNFPAGQFTISTDNIGEYFSLNGVFRQVVTCNNGTKREGNVTEEGWETLPDYKPGGTTVSSLGTTIVDSSTYTFSYGRDGISGFRYVVRGEGGKSVIRDITSGLRSANELTSISLSLGSSSIDYNSTTTATVTAKYTSGALKGITDSLSTSPSATSNYIKSGDTSIVTIS